jgi:hypothetical protein
MRLRLRPTFATAFAGVFTTAVLVAACGGKSPDSTQASDEAGTNDSGVAPDEGAVVLEGGAESGSDGGGASAIDGPPSYTSACTPLSAQTGTGINTYHGRLDGYLSYVVPKGGSFSCNGDQSHVHLQVRMNGAIYDVAVDIGTFTGDANLYEADMPLPGGAWAEGWHNVGLSYTQLGVHSTQFTAEDPTALGQKIASELTGVNHVSVFGDSYTTHNGCHDVHYENGTLDGALVINPLSPTAHVLFFRFSTQTF